MFFKKMKKIIKNEKTRLFRLRVEQVRATSPLIKALNASGPAYPPDKLQTPSEKPEKL
jgi:hypothetical protein